MNEGGFILFIAVIIVILSSVGANMIGNPDCYREYDARSNSAIICQ
jgi:hypothetical protein